MGRGLTGLWPFALPLSDGARSAQADLRRMGERGVGAPPSPSLRLSKHTPLVKESSIWSRKKSPIWCMCSDPPRYYNLNNRQAGCPLNLPPPKSSPAFHLPLAAVLGRHAVLLCTSKRVFLACTIVHSLGPVGSETADSLDLLTFGTPYMVWSRMKMHISC